MESDVSEPKQDASRLVSDDTRPDASATADSSKGRDASTEEVRDASAEGALICDDGFPCTISAYVEGRCTHTVGPNWGATQCPMAQYCTLDKGCVLGGSCTSNETCKSLIAANPCVLARCNVASATCEFLPPDEDNDGHISQQCGRDDCDDKDSSVFPGAQELCNDRDEDCDLRIDDGASCSDPLRTCQSGECKCRAGMVECRGVCVEEVSCPIFERGRIEATDNYLDKVGRSISLSPDGNTVLVGASGSNVKGAAYVFSRTGGQWIQKETLRALNGAMDDQFGWATALSADGNTALIGAPQRDVETSQDQGAVYVFTRNAGAWNASDITTDRPAYSNRYGTSVALSSDGNTALVGANRAPVGANTLQGAAYVFVRSADKWTLQSELNASDGANYDGFGWRVVLSLDGNTALVCASPDGMIKYRGAAYVFIRTGENWTQQAKLTADDAEDNDNFGYSCTLSSDANTAVIGAPYKAIGSNAKQGAVYFFSKTAQGWKQEKLVARDGGNAHYFGSAVALSSTSTLLIGAVANRSAYVFTRTQGPWIQERKLSLDSNAESPGFGYSVALSNDGCTALVGAINFNRSGAVFHYDLCTFNP